MYGRLIHGKLGEFLHDGFPILILVFGVLACVAYALPNRPAFRRYRTVVGTLLFVSAVVTASLAMMAAAEEEAFAGQWALLAVFTVLAAIAVRPAGESAAVGQVPGPPAPASAVPGPVPPPPWLGQPSPEGQPGQSGRPGQPAQPGWQPTASPSPSPSASEQTQQLPPQPTQQPQSHPTSQPQQPQPLQPPPPPPQP